MTPSSLLRVAIYARVSSRDKDQNPETQLLPLREFVAAQGWSAAGSFVDKASALDLKARTAWRDLLDPASKRRFDLVVIWRSMISQLEFAPMLHDYGFALQGVAQYALYLLNRLY